MTVHIIDQFIYISRIRIKNETCFCVNEKKCPDFHTVWHSVEKKIENETLSPRKKTQPRTSPHTLKPPPPPPPYTHTSLENQMGSFANKILLIATYFYFYTRQIDMDMEKQVTIFFIYFSRVRYAQISNLA